MSLSRHDTVAMIAVGAFVATLSAANAAAQGRLAGTTGLDCTFTMIATGTWTAGACDIEGRDDVYLEWDPPTTGADCWVDVERSDIPTERTSYSTCGYFERLGNGLTES